MNKEKDSVIVETPKPMRVAIVKPEDVSLLQGKAYDKAGSRFNPTQDANGNYVVSELEIASCTDKDLAFLKALPLTEYAKPAPYEWWL